MYFSRFNKYIISFLCAVLFLSGITPHAKEYTPSKWAQSTVALADELGIIPSGSESLPYTSDIKRNEFCSFAVSLYNVFTGKDMPTKFNSHFTDTNDKYVFYCADLGIINGRGEGIFSPNDAITRQEMSVIITRLLTACGIDASISDTDVKAMLSTYNDANKINDWAKSSIAFCIKNSIIQGMSEDEIWPLYHTTREQAIVIIYRCFDKFKQDDTDTPDNAITPLYATGDYENLKASVDNARLISYNDRCINLEFNTPKKSGKYKIDVYLDSSNFWYCDEDIYVKTIYSTTQSFTFDNLRIAKKYKFNIYDESNEFICSAGAYISPLYSLDEKENIVFSHGQLESKQDADSVMQNIKVDVWRVGVNGNKYRATQTLTIHKSIAEITKSVFKEIFESKSQFPIKDAGAYAWRDEMSSGRYSHHNYGTAIDINYNENYCLYNNGTFVGNGWFPGDDPHSISADSEIVSIFSKYGFIWGGDEWSNPKDYMHFSFLEL